MDAKTHGEMRVRIFALQEVIALLQRDVDKAGGQRAWSKGTGVDRSLLNQVLRGRRQPSPRIIKALDLRVVFTGEAAGGREECPPCSPAAATRVVSTNLVSRAPYNDLPKLENRPSRIGMSALFA